MTVSESLRKAIRTSISQSRITQEEIARRAGISQSQLSLFLGRKRTLNLKTVDRLAKVLDWPGTTPEYILVTVGTYSALVAKKGPLLGFGGFREYTAVTERGPYERALVELSRLAEVNRLDT